MYVCEGHETTSSTLLWIFFDLSLHPEIQVLCSYKYIYIYIYCIWLASRNMMCIVSLVFSLQKKSQLICLFLVVICDFVCGFLCVLYLSAIVSRGSRSSFFFLQQKQQQQQLFKWRWNCYFRNDQQIRVFESGIHTYTYKHTYTHTYTCVDNQCYIFGLSDDWFWL